MEEASRALSVVEFVLAAPEVPAAADVVVAVTVAHADRGVATVAHLGEVVISPHVNERPRPLD